MQNISFSFISTSLFFVSTGIAKAVFLKLGFVEDNSTERLNIALFPLPVLSIVIAYYIVSISPLTGFDNVMLSLIVLGLLLVNVLVFASDSDSKKKYQYRAARHRD